MKIGIIASPDRKVKSAEEACKNINVEYTIIDIFSVNWVEEIKRECCNGYLLIPPHSTSLWRDLYKKRLFLMRDEFTDRCLPSLESVIFYESKILMSDIYKIYSIPHAEMNTFMNYKEAINYAEQTSYPIVMKSDGGSGGIGIKFINNSKELKHQIYKSFFYKAKFRGIHKLGDIKNYIKRKLYPYVVFKRTKKGYIPPKEINSGYIHLQHFAKVKTEWRIIRIGESFFSHQKLMGENNLHSGSKRKNWELPTDKLLNDVKMWSDKININSGAFDVFETEDGEFLVNEIQAHFGTSLQVQMYKDGIPGRLILFNNKWIFEEGDFCQYDCNLLKIKELIKL